MPDRQSAPRAAGGDTSAQPPASIASGFARAPAGTAAPASAAPAASAPQTAVPVAVPEEVQAAAEQRQNAKITRGMQSNPGGGVCIESAPPGSLASQMHLEPGDVLKAVNNQALSSPEDFARIYRAQGLPGEIVVIRDGRELHRR